LINNSYPRATTGDGNVQTEADWKVEQSVVKRGAYIGSEATIFSNTTIGKNAIVGAGSVLIKDVAANNVVAGNPVKFLRHINQIVGLRNDH
jgi:acetyltransferase-like isoleucine patch superfamily enzyme